MHLNFCVKTLVPSTTQSRPASLENVEKIARQLGFENDKARRKAL
ncbi:3484_t:CDS:2 [Scutellospora calospora]|uniref:3484_t:CDS:1 n=1 Tax=Scutellospora calospora TaxID=85575 RepID=A0ACA9KJ55_9GLOM|nr:3484_t:CDS:2 [Scutellospora calospora]